jgi:hypothetical protein
MNRARLEMIQNDLFRVDSIFYDCLDGLSFGKYFKIRLEKI